MKSYESQNSHETYCKACESGNTELAAAVVNAWHACDNFDPYCEWDEMTIGEILDVLDGYESGQNLRDQCELAGFFISFAA